MRSLLHVMLVCFVVAVDGHVVVYVGIAVGGGGCVGGCGVVVVGGCGGVGGDVGIVVVG